MLFGIKYFRQDGVSPNWNHVFCCHANHFVSVINKRANTFNIERLNYFCHITDTLLPYTSHHHAVTNVLPCSVYICTHIYNIGCYDIPVWHGIASPNSVHPDRFYMDVTLIRYQLIV